MLRRILFFLFLLHDQKAIGRELDLDDMTHAGRSPATSGPERQRAFEITLSPYMQLDCEQLYDLAHGHAVAVFSADVHAHLQVSIDRLHKACHEQRPIYGLTTGFGPLADFHNAHQQSPTVQKNLIYHLASGVGEPLRYAEARALMATRLLTILRGFSGASIALAQRLLTMINADYAPYIPAKGTVGASGDLTPSAHLALALYGEGKWFDKAGHMLPGDEVMQQLNLPPLEAVGRDPLALVNGTACMTGLSALSVVEFSHLLDAAIDGAAAIAELLGARQEAYFQHFSNVRPHAGQAHVAARLRDKIGKSERLSPLVAHEKITNIKPPFQDAYSLRCLPQALGAVVDCFAFAQKTITDELNSVTDNPLITDDENQPVVHGGNFYGQHVAFAADILGAQATKVAIVLERQLDLICDPKRNGGRPNFLVQDQIGLNSGLMGAQVTASALLAEMRTQSGWASLQSVPTNGHNQDINTMGSTAARLARRNLKDLARIAAIHYIAIAEAVDCDQARGENTATSPHAAGLARGVRQAVKAIKGDRPLSDEIETLAQLLTTDRLPSP